MLQPFVLSMSDVSRSFRNSRIHRFCPYQIFFNSLLEYCKMTKRHLHGYSGGNINCCDWRSIQPQTRSRVYRRGRLTWNKYSLGKSKRHGTGSTTGRILSLSKGQFQVPLIYPKFLKAVRPTLSDTATKGCTSPFGNGREGKLNLLR